MATNAEVHIDYDQYKALLALIEPSRILGQTVLEVRHEETELDRVILKRAREVCELVATADRAAHNRHDEGASE